MPKSLNGYWTCKADNNRYIYVEKTFKKGYVTGFSYLSVDGKTVISTTPLKITHEELQNQYEKELKK